MLKKIMSLREAGLRAEHVAFSFMKKRVQLLMARDTSRMLDFEVEDVIIERLGKIFKDMLPYMPCLVFEYSAARPPDKDNSHDKSHQVLICLM
jgi:hypothetical protein